MERGRKWTGTKEKIISKGRNMKMATNVSCIIIMVLSVRACIPSSAEVTASLTDLLLRRDLAWRRAPLLSLLLPIFFQLIPPVSVTLLFLSQFPLNPLISCYNQEALLTQRKIRERWGKDITEQSDHRSNWVARNLSELKKKKRYPRRKKWCICQIPK